MALLYTWFKVLFGVVVWVCDRVFQKSGWLQVSSPTSWCALCLNVCQQHATCSCAEVGVVGFLCIHLVVVSEREISAFVMCVGVFCITMTKSGAGPNGCVLELAGPGQACHPRMRGECIFHSHCGPFLFGKACVL